MKKEKVVYIFYRYDGENVKAKREIPYEIRFFSRLILDELCFSWNKNRLQNDINKSIDASNRKEFDELCRQYRHYIWE